MDRALFRNTLKLRAASLSFLDYSVERARLCAGMILSAKDKMEMAESLEEKYDRWERFARLVYKRAIEDNRRSRKQLEDLKAWAEKQKKSHEAFLQQLKDDRVDRNSQADQD